MAYAQAVGEAPPVAVVEEAEGLRLHLSSRNATGYTGVNKERRRFRARFNEIHLGCFDTAVEAAVLWPMRARSGRRRHTEQGHQAPARRLAGA